jgi:hypothetical protein
MTCTLRTPSANGTTFTLDIDAASSEIVITSQSGGQHRYHLDALKELYLWLKITKNCEWVYLGTKNENEIPNPGTVEEWARSACNPRRGFYGTTPGLKGRFASFVPPILELMGFVEIEHNANNNRIRAK